MQKYIENPSEETKTNLKDYQPASIIFQVQFLIACHMSHVTLCKAKPQIEHEETNT